MGQYDMSKDVPWQDGKFHGHPALLFPSRRASKDGWFNVFCHFFHFLSLQNMAQPWWIQSWSSWRRSHSPRRCCLKTHGSSRIANTWAACVRWANMKFPRIAQVSFKVLFCQKYAVLLVFPVSFSCFGLFQRQESEKPRSSESQPGSRLDLGGWSHFFWMKTENKVFNCFILSPVYAASTNLLHFWHFGFQICNNCLLFLRSALQPGRAVPRGFGYSLATGAAVTRRAAQQLSRISSAHVMSVFFEESDANRENSVNRF